MAKRRPVLAALLLCGIVPAAAAQQAVRSAGPDSVEVTVYRAPHRPVGQRMDLSWLDGFALISETRRVAIPAGESDIRFEGVAGGILPESAIVAGLPEGVVEKNQDAMLLSPGSLVDASLGKRVHLRRTSRATGTVRETEAIVRSGADGAVVLQTPDGIESLRCSGLPETLVYDEVLPGLSARPTLSVKVRAEAPRTAELTLSYLASNFDWQASYVARLSPNGERMDLFAWLTLANGDETGFREADTQAVAGRLNRSAIRAPRPRVEPLRLECWPLGTTTSHLSEEEIVVTGSRVFAEDLMLAAPPAPPPPPPPPPPAMMAKQEELGDLKLYRIPEPVTVAAKSQKQVALMQKEGIKVQQVYRQRFYALDPGQPTINRVVIARNTAAAGLGLPLPAGRVAFFTDGRERPLLLGQGTMRDHAVGEEVELVLGAASGVSAQFVPLSPSAGPTREWELIVANARPVPVRYEAEIDEYGSRFSSTAKLARRDGRPVWVVTVPANGRATLRFSAEPPPKPEPPRR